MSLTIIKLCLAHYSLMYVTTSAYGIIILYKILFFSQVNSFSLL